MISPHTPILQTSGPWDRNTNSPPPLSSIPTPPPRNKVRRKPVPQLLNTKAMFEYTPPQADAFKPIVPLNLGAKARDKLNIEREYVQCMVCRNSSFVTCTAELVCSHYVHPRCLQQFVTSTNSSSGDAYPPCQICKYPAKPKDQLLNQHIRTTLLRIKQLETTTPPPRSVHRPVRARSSSVYSKDAGPLGATISDATPVSGISSDANEQFKPFQSRVPIQVSVQPVVKALSITAQDPSCQFLVTVGCPDYTYSQPTHQPSILDERISSRTATCFAEALDIPRDDLGHLRLERRFEYSSDGGYWITVRALLFEHALILASSDLGTPILYTDLSTNLLSVAMVSGPDASVCLALQLQSMPKPVYITSNNREHLYSFTAAIGDKSLSFPLSRTKSSMVLQSPFIGDYVHCLPCHTVVCVPESFSLNILAEAVGRLRVFDRIGVVQYGSKTTSFPLSRQSWQRWQSLLSKEAITPLSSANQSSSDVLLAASKLFRDGEKAACSIILLSDREFQVDASDVGVPVYCIGTGSDYDASALSRISATSGGHYVHSSRDNVSQYVTNMVFGDQALTHKDTRVTLKPRKGILSGVSGYSSSPGENSTTINENGDGHLVLDLGRLHAGHKQKFIASVDIDPKILKYSCEGSELDILEVVVEASLANSGAAVLERRSGRVKIELHEAPSTFFSGLHSQVPTSSNDRLEVYPERIVLAAATSLARVAKLVQGSEHTPAASIVHKVVQNLERAAEHISAVCKCATKHEADLVLSCSTMIDVLLCDAQFLQNHLTEKSILAIIHTMIWTLRSGRSFSRNSSLEAIYFDTNKLNVL